MAKFRCSLCDGRLNSEGRCTFCGLDNTKSDRYYRLNESNCDGASFTHVHEDDGTVRNAKKMVVPKKTVEPRQSTAAKRTDHGINGDHYEAKVNRIKIIVIILVIIGILLQVLPALTYKFSNSFSEPQIEEFYDYDFFGDDNDSYYDDGDDSYYEDEADDYYDEYFEDSESLEEFLEKYGQDFFGEFDDEMIVPDPGNQTPSDGKL